jgi:heme/copper-type cytochrome/quinol oxidase subunit 2
MSIFGFTSFILIVVYTIFLLISGKLKDITFNSLTDNFISSVPLTILGILWLVSGLLYGLLYKNVKKSKNRRINSQRKRQRNIAHAIFIFSVVGSVLFALLCCRYYK